MHHILRILASMTSKIPSCSRDLQVYEKEFYHLTQVSNCTYTNELPAGLVCFRAERGVSVEGKALIRNEIQEVIDFILGEKGISSLANA